MKHFMDIQVLRQTGIDSEPNDGAFYPGDWIQVTEKIDGANASMRFNTSTQQFTAFSRKEELDAQNNLRGFYDYVQNLNPALFHALDRFVFFGEWLVPHAVQYDKERYNRWYVYDVWDTIEEHWMKQDFVRVFCHATGLAYVHVLYEGPFINWDHIKELAKGKSAYGADCMEGVVVKNMDRIHDTHLRYPKYLKYINAEFAETKKHPVREVDPEKEAEANAAKSMMSTICTKERVRKEIFKCIDEGLLTPPFGPESIRAIAQIVPKRIYQDLLKEERTIVEQCGEYAGKLSGSMTMQWVKALLLEGVFNGGIS